MKKSKVLSLILAAALCFSLLVLPAFAASVQKDGLELTLTTDKAEYTATENIVATLQVKNASETAMENLNLVVKDLAGYDAVGDSSKSVTSLTAGAADSLEVTFAVEGPSKTGDGILSVILVMVAAGACLVLLGANRKGIAMLLAVVMVFGIAAIGLPTVSAAEDALTVSTTVKVDGKNVTIEASATWNMPETTEPEPTEPEPTEPEPTEPEPTNPPAEEPVDMATVLGTTYFTEEITFGLNHAVLGYVGYIFQPDGSMQADVFGQTGDYGRYGIVTEGDKQYVLSVETKDIADGKVLPSKVVKWELTEVEGLKVLKVTDIGDATEVKEMPVDIWTTLGTNRFDAEITFGTEDNSSTFTFKTDGTITGTGVGASYSHYGIVEKDGKTYVAMFQAAAVADGKALASKVELYELAGEGAAQTITYLFLGIPFVLTVK